MEITLRLNSKNFSFVELTNKIKSKVNATKMSLSALKWISIGAVTSMLAYANLPSRFYALQKASEKVLASAKLRRLDPLNTEIVTAGDLWKRNGAVIMAVRRPG